MYLSSIVFTALVATLVHAGSASLARTIPDSSTLSAPLNAATRHLLDRRLDVGACLMVGGAVAACLNDLQWTEEEKVECASCMDPEYESAVASFNETTANCDAWTAFLCAGFDTCACVSSCVEEYNPYADCYQREVTAELGLSLECDISCGSSSTGGGSGSGTATDSGSASSGGSGGTPSGGGGVERNLHRPPRAPMRRALQSFWGSWRRRW